MREIKFRGWIKNRKIMGEVKGIGFFRPDNPLVSLRGYKEGEGDWQCSAILMQYTGLKDRKGVGIYEEDIVKMPSGRVTQIYFCDGSYRFDIGGGLNGYRSETIGSYEGFEVIGNIYENPELIKDSKC